MIKGIIEEVTRRIVENFSPEKIILFGSYGRGTPGPDSDLDLLVVMNCPNSPREQAVGIRRLLADLPVGKDVIVVTPEYFQRYRDLVGTVIWPAVREGKVLYERAA